MRRDYSFIHLTGCIFSLILIFMIATAQPLSTRQKIDRSGRRVKLASVDRAAHRGLAVAEGLGKQPVSKLSLLGEPGSANARPHKVIFHPMTGLCVQYQKKLMQPLQLGSCSEAEKWSYTPKKTLTVTGTYFCLQADQLGKPANLGIICSESNSKWEVILSDSKMQLSSKLKNGGIVCLDVDTNNVIVTYTCKCQSGSECDPGSQRFEINASSKETNG